MGHRRYRNNKPDAVSEFFELLVQIAGASPLIGCIVGAVFVGGAAVLWRMRSYYPLFGFLAGFIGVVLFIAAGVGAILLRFRRDDAPFATAHWTRSDSTPPRIPQPLPPPVAQTAMPYRRKFEFVTKGERAFYEVLRHVVNGRQEILIKVRLGDLLYIPPGSGYEWRNKANQKHVDFVLCDPADLRPRLVIELDDKTHDQPGRIERDRFVDEALACAEIPVLHVRAAVAYEVQELKAQIARALSSSSA